MSETFFPRGDGPLVSVLIPSRGRPNQLPNALSSLFSKAKDKSLVEVVIKVDEDDEQTQKAIAEYRQQHPVECVKVVTSCGGGYPELNRYYNECANESSGDWLMVYNDDVEMLTDNWDEHLLYTASFNSWIGVTDVCCMPLDDGIGGSVAFSLTRRKAWQLLGTMSPTTLIDNWLFAVFGAAQATMPSVIKVYHLPGAWVEYKQKDITEDGIDPWWTYCSPDALDARLRAIGTLVDHMKLVRKGVVWSAAPNSVGWWWWRKHQNTAEYPMWVDGKRVLGPKKSGRTSDFVEYRFEDLKGEWGKLK